MKWIVTALGFLLLFTAADLRAEKYYPAGLDDPGPGGVEAGPGQLGRPRAVQHRGSGRYRDIRFKQFRREVREMGVEVRENALRIEQLERELADLPPGPEAAEAERRLEALRRRQAELRLLLARKKVAFTLRALEVAEGRYQEALEELEEVRENVKLIYPDLADLPPVE